LAAVEHPTKIYRGCIDQGYARCVGRIVGQIAIAAAIDNGAGILGDTLTATEAASESGLVDFAEENAPHTFSERAGHIADTPANRAVIQDAISPETYIRTTPQGVKVYQKLLPDGTQSWAQVFNGSITNGGVNDVPRGG
jgi:hypothetical protein